MDFVQRYPPLPKKRSYLFILFIWRVPIATSINQLGVAPKVLFCFERVVLICLSQIFFETLATPPKKFFPLNPFKVEKKCGTIGNILGNTLGT